MNESSRFEVQAEFCRAMGNSVRLEILYLLRQRPMKVGEIIQATDYEQATVSRHLGIMRQLGILATHGLGRDVIYSIANPRIVVLCDLVRQVLVDQAAEKSRILSAWENTG